MKIRPLLIFFLFLIFAPILNAQIKGKVTDTNGEPLPFASIYIQGTSRGTDTNVNGEFEWNLPKGDYKIVFQYVGYKQKTESISIDDEVYELNVVLEEEALVLQEVVVRANAEDPAYAIIRKAQAKRKYYKGLLKEYSCDVYIKGLQKLLDAPEKIFGEEIGDLGGSLDSNRQGIIYLSESLARYHFKQPNLAKEQMISSKVSGNDNGFSWNRASMINFSFYDNNVELLRKIISPIAENAMAYYRYKLMGTIFDEDGRLINKIEVIAKRADDPVFRGYIYILEDTWNIQSTNLYVTGSSIKEPVLDTLYVKQVHVPVKEPDVWCQLSQTLEFNFDIFKFKGEGSFTGVFSNYDLAPNFSDGFFTNEIFKVEDDANLKSLNYWDSIRPIPLTEVEEIDYVRKDSLQKIWESKSFLDSIDAKNNKFKFFDLLSGYEYRNSYKRKSFSIGSPLTTVQFNTIQGFYGNLNISYRKTYNKERTRYIEINPRLQYGFSDNKFRASGEFVYNFNRVNFSQIKISGGQSTAQFNINEPVPSFLNSYYSLFSKKNYLKIYDKTFAKIHYRQELKNGLYFRGYTEYANRSPLVNTTDYSFFNKDRAYTSNDPINPENLGNSFEENQMLTFNLGIRLRVKQKYLSYPKRKYIMGSKWPTLWIQYRKGIAINGDRGNFDQLRINIIEDDLNMGLVGYSHFHIEGGIFLNKDNMYFLDYKHFNGNQLFISNPDKYLNSYKQLAYYDYSTNQPYLQAFYEHHFEGFLLDKIPLISKLGLKTVFGASFLYTKEKKDYFELSIGIDNLGFKVLRIFRVDVVSSFVRGKYDQTGVVLGVKL